MNKKVEKLVEWMANTIRDYDIFHGHAAEDCSVSSYLEVSKQLLSHPDLALIDRGRKFKTKRLKVNSSFNDYMMGVEDTIGDGCVYVIPLAEAIKEA